MNTILAKSLIIISVILLTLLCEHFLFHPSAAYSQGQSPYRENDMGAIPQSWGRLVDFGKMPVAYMVFESNDGTIRLFYNRKGKDYFKIGDDDMSIEIFKRK
jgi:hypothetical protein